MGTNETRAEGEGRSMAGARWAAMKELERLDSDLDLETVAFEAVDEGERDGEKYVRVAAVARGEDDQEEDEREEDGGEDAEDDQEEDDQEEDDQEEDDQQGREDREAAPRATRPTTSATARWPKDPGRRVKALLEAVLEGLGVEGAVDVEDGEEELRGNVEGEELGELIGRHGHTIDAVQVICTQAAYRGQEDRKRVVVDAAGYRERRAEALERQADRTASDAVRSGRAMEMDPMSAQERRVVHTYLKDRPEVETHSEGDEPYRFVVISPVGV